MQVIDTETRASWQWLKDAFGLFRRQPLAWLGLIGAWLLASLFCMLVPFIGFSTMHLLQPGDIAGIITFVGGDATQISATVQVKKDSKVILLERAHFESLLNSNPAIVYYVMRGIVRHVHGIVRRMNMQSVEMTNYIHRTGGRY